MKKITINIIVVVGAVIIMRLFLPRENETHCKLYQDFVDLNIYGVVTDKYLDQHEHSDPIIEIKSFKDDSILKVNLVGERSDLYDLISKLDTIRKIKNTDVVFRKEEGVFLKLIKVDFGCKDNKR